MFGIGEFKNNSNIIKYELVIILWLIILSEGLTKYFFYYSDGFHRIGLIVKGLIYVYCSKAVFTNKNFVKENKWLVLLFVTSFIGALALKNTNFQASIFNFFISFIKYSFPVFLYLNFIKKTDVSIKRFFLKHIAYAVLLNIFFCVLGLIFKIEFFRSYPFSDRFGYDGLFFRSWTASYFYLIAIIAFLNIDKKIFKLALYLAIGFGLFLGTKLAFLGILLILIYHVFKKNWHKEKSKALIVISGFIILIVSFKIWFSRLFNVILNVYKEDGLITAFFSHRNVSFKNVIVPYVKESWSSLNYLFGSGDNYFIYSEMDIIDVFLMFGLFSILFIYTYYYKMFGNKYMLFLTFFIGVFFSGNFFNNSTATFLFFFAASSFGDYSTTSK